MYITFQGYKHLTGRPHIIVVHARSGNPCPVESQRSYLAYRCNSPGPLFLLPPGRPVSRGMFPTTVNTFLHFLGTNASVYKTHSFRIDAASHATLNGMTDAKIMYIWGDGTVMPSCHIFGWFNVVGLLLPPYALMDYVWWYPRLVAC